MYAHIVGAYAIAFGGAGNYPCLIGISTGIAGALSVIDDIAHRPNSTTKVWFVWSKRELNDVKCVAGDLRKAVSSSDNRATETRIRATIHVTGKQAGKEIANMTEEANSEAFGAAKDTAQDDPDPELAERNGDLGFTARLLRSGRPVWRPTSRALLLLASCHRFQRGKSACVLPSPPSWPM